MKATNIDNKGKIRKTKDILAGNCIFPFKYKGENYDKCVEVLLEIGVQHL